MSLATPVPIKSQQVTLTAHILCLCPAYSCDGPHCWMSLATPVPIKSQRLSLPLVAVPHVSLVHILCSVCNVAWRLRGKVKQIVKVDSSKIHVVPQMSMSLSRG